MDLFISVVLVNLMLIGWCGVYELSNIKDSTKESNRLKKIELKLKGLSDYDIKKNSQQR